MMSQNDPPGDDEDGGGGYGRPPKATRFTKGQRSNPAGRPRGRRPEAPYEAVLGQMVTIREGGVSILFKARECVRHHRPLASLADVDLRSLQFRPYPSGEGRLAE